MLMKALEIAKKAHSNQFDKGGKSYIEHPIAVSESVTTENEKILALLHDVVEDSNISIEGLASEGFNDEILVALSLITKKKEEPYFEYLQKVKNNSLAKAVKIADIKHNMDLSRLASITDNDLKRLEKYKEAFEYLTSKQND